MTITAGMIGGLIFWTAIVAAYFIGRRHGVHSSETTLRSAQSVLSAANLTSRTLQRVSEAVGQERSLAVEIARATKAMYRSVDLTQDVATRFEKVDKGLFNLNEAVSGLSEGRVPRRLLAQGENPPTSSPRPEILTRPPQRNLDALWGMDGSPLREQLMPPG